MKSNPKPPPENPWLTLDELPSMRARHSFQAAADWALKFAARKKTVPLPLRLPHEIETQLLETIDTLSRRILRSDDVAAARTLAHIADVATTRLNSHVLQKQELFRAIGRKTSAWPMIYSDMPDHRKRRDEVLKVLELGAESGINSTKVKATDRPRKFSESHPATKLTINFVAILTHLKVIATSLRGDSPTEEEFRVRAAGLAKRWKLPDSTLEVISSCQALGAATLQNAAVYHKLVTRLLRQDTGGYPERVVELRALAVYRATRATERFKKLQKELPSRTGEESETSVLIYLKSHLGPATIEREIREGVEQKLLAATRSWLRIPSPPI